MLRVRIMTPITVNLIENYTNQLLQEYEWTEESAPDWDLDYPDDEKSIYFSVELIGEYDTKFLITARVVYRNGILDEHNYDVWVGSNCIEESDTCYMEELEAVINKYVAIVGMKKKV